MAVTAHSLTADASRQIVISRTFDAPRSLVWKAWTDPAVLPQWWGPKGCTTTVVAMDVRVGGVFHLEMHVADGSIHPCHGQFREIVEPQRIVLFGTAHDGSPCGAGLPPQSIVTLTFEETNGHTTLTMTTQLRSASDRSAAVAAGFDEGWGASFDALAGQLAAATSPPAS